MKRVIVCGILAGLVLPLSGFSINPKSPVEGSWTGEFKSGLATLAFQVHFRTEESVLVGPSIYQKSISTAYRSIGS